jgi:predicted nucleic acid-binding protein
MHIVIDTQTVLDWRFFANPVCHAWPVPGGGPAGWTWLATPDMREELRLVLARPWPARWRGSPQEVLSFFDAHARMCPVPPGSGPTRMLRCTDPDDQKFIDLALAHAPCQLLTRDRALLKLARRALPRQVQILQPQAWQAPGAQADVAPGDTGI